MTTLQLDPPPFSRVSLALPAPPAGPSAEDASKKPVARRPSRFEVVKAPEMLASVDDQPQEQSPGSDPMTPSSVQSGDIEDVCEIFATHDWIEFPVWLELTANLIMFSTESLLGQSTSKVHSQANKFTNVEICWTDGHSFLDAIFYRHWSWRKVKKWLFN